MILRSCIFALCLAPAAFAQSYEPPRTPDGKPDLQGAWATSFATTLERPDELKQLVLSPEEARTWSAGYLKTVPDVIDPDFYVNNINGVARVRGDFRSSWIVEPKDGHVPFSDKALKLVDRSAYMDTQGTDGPEDRPTFDRCLAGLGQPPIRQIPALIPTQIVQTPDTMAVVTEDVGSLRIIHLDGRPPPPDVMRSFEGWSAGHWEGDTLVIETTHTRADDTSRGHFGRAVIVEADSKVIERFTRLSPTELLYQFTVVDPDLYTAPWLAEYSFTLADTAFHEYACHEGNYAMTNILLSGRVADMKAAAANKKPKPKGK